MPDIAGKLFPNLVTVITQLVATGIIYLMYKKFLHNAVLNYLNKREEFMLAEVQAATIQREEAEALKEQQTEDYKEAKAQLEVVKAEMLKTAQEQRDDIVKAGQVEVERRKLELELELESEKKRMVSEIEDYVLNVAIEVNRKVLSGIKIDQKDMIDNLEKEISSHDIKH